MLATSGYDLLKSHEALTSNDWLAIAIGFVVSFIVALLVIRWFVGVVTRHGFAPFAWYRFVAVGAALVWLMARGFPIGPIIARGRPVNQRDSHAKHKQGKISYPKTRFFRDLVH